MESKIEKFLDWAEDHRWKVRRYAGDTEIPAAILSRYENIPEEYLRFLRKTALLATPDETGWFNCRPDFEGASDSAFRWNEFEIISLQAAGHDEARRQDIRKFWDTNLPAFLSVKSGYAFHAINTD